MKEPEGSPRNLFQPKVSAGIYPFGTPITTRHPRIPMSLKLYQAEIDPVDKEALGFQVPQSDPVNMIRLSGRRGFIGEANL